MPYGGNHGHPQEHVPLLQPVSLWRAAADHPCRKPATGPAAARPATSARGRSGGGDSEGLAHVAVPARGRGAGRPAFRALPRGRPMGAGRQRGGTDRCRRPLPDRCRAAFVGRWAAALHRPRRLLRSVRKTHAGRLGRRRSQSALLFRRMRRRRAGRSPSPRRIREQQSGPRRAIPDPEGTDPTEHLRAVREAVPPDEAGTPWAAAILFEGMFRRSAGAAPGNRMLGVRSYLPNSPQEQWSDAEVLLAEVRRGLWADDGLSAHLRSLRLTIRHEGTERSVLLGVVQDVRIEAHARRLRPQEFVCQVVRLSVHGTDRAGGGGSSRHTTPELFDMTRRQPTVGRDN